MKVFDDLIQARLFLPESISKTVTDIIASFANPEDEEICQASFTELIGGPICLIERREDLAEVCTLETIGNRRLSMLEVASGWFDIAQWVDNRRFARFVIIEGNDGGPQYLIPRLIADQEPNVTASIRLTAERLGQ